MINLRLLVSLHNEISYSTQVSFLIFSWKLYALAMTLLMLDLISYPAAPCTMGLLAVTSRTYLVALT